MRQQPASSTLPAIYRSSNSRTHAASATTVSAMPWSRACCRQCRCVARSTFLSAPAATPVIIWYSKLTATNLCLIEQQSKAAKPVATTLGQGQSTAEIPYKPYIIAQPKGHEGRERTTYKYVIARRLSSTRSPRTATRPMLTHRAGCLPR